MNKKHIGQAFDDFLKDEGVYDAVEAAAVKRVLAYRLAQEMKARKMTKSELAHKMQTSRAALDRLLDEENTSVTLGTMARAASALGKKLVIELA